jgi:hypothetical protein
MANRKRSHVASITEALAVPQAVEIQPPRSQGFPRPLWLGPFQLLDVVVTSEALPAEGIAAGQTGQVLDEVAADAVLVEFANTTGMACAIVPVPVHQLHLVKRIVDSQARYT